MFFLPREIRSPFLDHVPENRQKLAGEGRSRWLIELITISQCLGLLVRAGGFVWNHRGGRWPGGFGPSRRPLRVGPGDLLVSDVLMPRMGGPELAERLRASQPALKVLFMSGYTDRGVAQHRILEANAAYVQKPISLETLARRVRQTLDADEQKGIDP
jgi:CheY-like chemotaxis protein